MATWYVDSTASGTNAGTSWVNACTSFTQLLALGSPPAAGDDIDVYSGSSSTETGTLAFPGTPGNPNRIFSCDKTNAPAQASDLVAGAVAATGSGVAFLLGGSFISDGVFWKAGNGSSTAASLTLGNTTTNGTWQQFLNGGLQLNSTGATAKLTLGTSTLADPAAIDIINTVVTFGATGQQISANPGLHRWLNTKSAIGGTVPTTLFSAATVGFTNVLLQGVDLSAAGSGKTLVGAAFIGKFMAVNCELNASATFAATPTQPNYGAVDFIACGASGVSYGQQRTHYSGALTPSTTIYNAATDGVTPISWQVITTGNASRAVPFEAFDIVAWVAPGTYSSAGGTYINAASATGSLTNADIWVEAQVMDTASESISDVYSSAPATPLTAGSGLASGSAWTAPVGSANNYKLVVPTFTVTVAGFVRFRVKVAKASLTIYIDPLAVVA